jgi:chemotaxis protein methyltransferase CheR
MENKIRLILGILLERADLDFSGCSLDMLKRRISIRFMPTHCQNFDDYYQYLQSHEEEIQYLLQAVTIKVSHFFRNPLDFEILNKITGRIIQDKQNCGEPLRIWSAGCATGEEAYSMAIIASEHMADTDLETEIFGTDLDPKALSLALKGVYNKEAVKEIKFGLLQKYFNIEDDKFTINDSIKKKVHFSVFDLVNKNHFAPSESIYGNFDIILCRNVLIYYSMEYQKIILDKIYKSLNMKGYLHLGEAETLFENYHNKFTQVTPVSKLFKKTG